MNNNLLITSEDMREFVRLPESLEPEQIDLHIKEAQEIEIAELLGDELYYEMISNLTQQRFIDLLKGKVYTDSSGHNIKFPGLRVVLIYYAYARYIGERNIEDTETGMVVKKNDWSDPVDPKEIARKINNARSSGESYQRRVTRFIIDNSSDYILWNGYKRDASTSGVSIRKAGGRKNRNPHQYPQTKNRCDDAGF